MISAMPSHLPASLSAERKAVLIAATSGRALAQAAAQAGYLPLTADFFCDLDTIEAGPAMQVAGDFSEGFHLEHLRPALEALAEGHEPAGLVYGSGFEAKPDMLGELAGSWPLIGNDPDVVTRAKNPFHLAEICKAAEIPHPEVSNGEPADAEGWLRKTAGATGGGHVRPHVSGTDWSGDNSPKSPRHYYQRRVAGVPISALFLGDGKGAILAGFSSQWASPTISEPYRYGGALQPAVISTDVARRLSDAVHSLAAVLQLKGLNSADFVVNGEEFFLIEVNPRPGATLDIFDSRKLFEAHVAACSGRMPEFTALSSAVVATAVVYATCDVTRVPSIDWPAWALDRQAPGTRVEAGKPLCTVKAEGDDEIQVLAAIEKRSTLMREMLQAEGA